jgi:hypothetical protein
LKEAAITIYRWRILVFGRERISTSKHVTSEDDFNSVQIQSRFGALQLRSYGKVSFDLELCTVDWGPGSGQEHSTSVLFLREPELLAGLVG